MALLSIQDDTQQNDASMIEKGMEQLESVLLNNLRKGDVIARWSSNQYVLMLPGLAYEHGEKVMQRIKNAFNQTNQYLT